MGAPALSLGDGIDPRAGHRGRLCDVGAPDDRDEFSETTAIPVDEVPESERRVVLLITNVMFSGGVMEISLPASGEAAVSSAAISAGASARASRPQRGQWTRPILA